MENIKITIEISQHFHSQLKKLLQYLQEEEKIKIETEEKIYQSQMELEIEKIKNEYKENI